MNKLVGPVLTPGPTLDTTSLEDLLKLATKFGMLRLSMHDNGWYCAIDMHVSAVGAAFKVASDFGQATPKAAVLQCIDRVNALPWAQLKVL